MLARRGPVSVGDVNPGGIQEPASNPATATFEQVVAALMQRWPESRIDPSLDRITELLNLLGAPHLALPVIQVTGTNGKSSTARMIASLLEAMGLRTGLYTSPHLIDVTERIEIDGKPLDRDAFTQVWKDIAPYVAMTDEQNGTPLSFFEVLTAMAYASFADAPVDVAVVEVGMGGRWDATSVAPAQVAVVLTVDLDHMDYLGETVADIAREKAAIIASDGTAVIGRQRREVIEVISERLELTHATAFWQERDFEVTHREVAVGGQVLALRGIDGEYVDVFVPAYGEHQAFNTACAITAVEAFLGGKSLDAGVIEEGLGALRTPGRLEIVRRGPTVVIDSAHNPAGARALAAALSESFAFTHLVAVVAVLDDKDVQGILLPLADVVDEIVVTANHSPRALGVDALAAVAVEIFGSERVEVAASFADAIDTAVRLAEEADTYAASGVIITGSVVSAGQARALLTKSRDRT
ncbi:MAG: bifunctional folylpolyglutamate synthase/dihydrofolate synthase [Actinomycetes bacterium]